MSQQILLDAEFKISVVSQVTPPAELIWMVQYYFHLCADFKLTLQLRKLEPCYLGGGIEKAVVTLEMVNTTWRDFEGCDIMKDPDFDSTGDEDRGLESMLKSILSENL